MTLVATIPEWIQAGAAVGIVILTGWTLKVLREYAKDTKTISEMSQKSAEAQRNSERPWLLPVEMERSGENVRVADGQSEQRLAAYFLFKNFGKTPAFIVSILGGVAIVSDINEPFSPKLLPPYGGADELIIAPNEKSGDIKFVMDRKYTDAEWGALTVSPQHTAFVFFGEIRYTDTFGARDEVRVSRFCYRYSFPRPSGFHFICGPKEFNEYT